MTRELITVNDDAMLEEIAEILEKRRIKRVPVIHVNAQIQFFLSDLQGKDRRRI